MTYSKENGYSLDFKSINSPTIKLLDYGDYLYDHMIILATSEMGFIILFLNFRKYF